MYRARGSTDTECIIETMGIHFRRPPLLLGSDQCGQINLVFGIIDAKFAPYQKCRLVGITPSFSKTLFDKPSPLRQLELRN